MIENEYNSSVAYKLSEIYDEIEWYDEKNDHNEDCSLTDGIAIASILYLQKIGAIEIILHNEEEIEDALFTTTKQEVEALYSTDFIESYSDVNEIESTNKFKESSNKKFTRISLVFKIPHSKIGELTKFIIDKQRNRCKNAAEYIRMVLFCQKYVINNDTYLECLKVCLNDGLDLSVQYLIRNILRHKPKNLYDPFMRTGENSILTENLYHGQTFYEYFQYTTMLNAGIAGIDTENVEIEDCIENWEPRDCDTIIATPSLNEKVTLEDGTTEPISTWCLEKVYKSMNETCRQGVLILPASILTSYGKAEQLRHNITESNLLDTVILLPANIFYESTIATAIIILNNNREYLTPISFADFSSLTKEPINFDWDFDKPTLDIDAVCAVIENNNPEFISQINVSEIKENNYEWFPPKYVNNQKEIPSGYIKHKISDIIIKDDSYHEDSGKYNYLLKDADLTSNIFTDYINHTEITEISRLELDNIFFGNSTKKNITDEYDSSYADSLEDEHHVYNGTSYLSCIHTCRFIIDYKEELNTYYYDPKDNKITTIYDEKFPFKMDVIQYCLVVPDEYYRYHINPDLIHIGYLRMLLSQTYSEVRKTYTSENIEDIIKTFMNTEVVIPLAIEEQEKLYEQAKTNYILEKARKEGLDDAIKSLKEEYMMEVRMRKHDMKPSLTQLDSLAKLLVHYVDQIEGNETTVSSIKQKLENISTEVEKLRLHLNRLTEEDIYGIAELINPIESLKEFTGTFSNYKVELEVDTIAFKEAGINTPQIYISKVDFATLCTTIIENAVTHAFIGNDEDYRILITLTYNKEQSNYIIDFINNGFGMPLGMDKFRYGLKGEKGANSKGTGLGGYRVKSITHHFDGDYDVFCNSARNKTVIRVKLPKYNVYE